MLFVKGGALVDAVGDQAFTVGIGCRDRDLEGPLWDINAQPTLFQP
jgi:hypothetical protein